MHKETVISLRLFRSCDKPALAIPFDEIFNDGTARSLNGTKGKLALQYFEDLVKANYGSRTIILSSEIVGMFRGGSAELRLAAIASATTEYTDFDEAAFGFESSEFPSTGVFQVISLGNAITDIKGLKQCIQLYLVRPNLRFPEMKIKTVSLSLRRKDLTRHDISRLSDTF